MLMVRRRDEHRFSIQGIDILEQADDDSLQFPELMLVIP